MAGATLTTADSVLKEFYVGPIREQLNDTQTLLGYVEKNSEDVEGRRAVLSLHVSRSTGVGARSEGGTLPTAGSQGYAEERVTMRYNYGVIQVTGPMIKAMASDKGSFTRAVDSESKRVSNDLKRDVNRQLWGTSDAVIATCGTTTSSTTLTLAASTTANQIRQIFDAGSIDLGTTADVDAVAAGVSVTDFSISGKTVTLGTAVTTSGTTKVFRAGVGGGGASANKEISGLQSIVANSGALHNVDPANYPVWKSYVDSNSGTLRSLSENLIASVLHNVEINGGEAPNLAVTTDGVFRAFGQLLTAEKRFTNTVDLHGGFKGLDLSAGGGAVPMVWDRDCPGNQMFLLNTAYLTEFQMSDWDWMDQDGAILSRVSGQDAYTATLFKYHEFATPKRNAHGLIKDITEA